MLTFESHLLPEEEETKGICRDKLPDQYDISNITTSLLVCEKVVVFPACIQRNCLKQPRLWLVLKEKLPLLKLR